MPRRATYKCPRCGSRDIVPIKYGYPSWEMQDDRALGKIKLGGCGIRIDPMDRYCNDCEHEWRKTDNYKKLK